MRKFIFKRRIELFFLAILISLSACANSSNSNVAVLSRDTPTPPTSENSQLTPAASPTNSSTAAVGSPSSPLPASSVNPTVSPVVNDPFVKGGGDTDAAVDSAMTSEILMIPVVGIKGKDLRDTFDDARSEGRVHDAIDIMAPGGTPVVAAANGKIIKFFDSERGGITVYQLSPDEHTIYYYAHLERRAADLREGAIVKQGDLIGYVGDTGNAGAGNYHLHFAIWTISDPKHFYDGTNINPYPILKDGIVKQQ